MERGEWLVECRSDGFQLVRRCHHAVPPQIRQGNTTGSPLVAVGKILVTPEFSEIVFLLRRCQEVSNRKLLKRVYELILRDPVTICQY